MAAKTLKPGPLAGQDLSLLKAGTSVLLDPHWGPMIFDRFDDSERRAFLTGIGDGQVRLLIPAKMPYLGERGPDGWIAAPEGGWRENPVPGMMIEAWFAPLNRGEEGIWKSELYDWPGMSRFRPAEAQAPTDQSAEAAEKVEGADTLAGELGVVAWLYVEHRKPSGKDTIRKSVTTHRQAVSPEDIAEFETTEDALTPHAEATRLLAEAYEKSDRQAQMLAERDREIEGLRNTGLMMHGQLTASRRMLEAAEADAAKLREAATMAHHALLGRKPHSVPNGEEACEALRQALQTKGRP